MGNEMGNNNVSGMKEEENAAVEVLEEAQEPVPADEDKGENHVTPEDLTKDFHLSSNGQSAVNNSDAERRESNEKEIGGEESTHQSKSPEASTESNDSNSQDGDIQKKASPDEGKYEQPLEPNLEANISSSGILQIHDLPSTPKETDAKELDRSDSTDSETTSQPSITPHHSTRSLEDTQFLLSNQSEEVAKMKDTCHLEEKENAQNVINREEYIDDLEPEVSRVIEDEFPETKTGTETCETKSAKDNIGDLLENEGDGQVHLRTNLCEFSDSSTEAALQFSSLDPTPEPQEKRIIHAEEIDLASHKSEKGENKQDSNTVNSSMQTFSESTVSNSTPSMVLQDTSCKENAEEVVLQLNSNSGLKKVYHTGETKMTHKRSRSILAGQKGCVSLENFEDTEEVIKMLPTVISASTELSSMGKYDEEKRTTEEREDVSSSRAIKNDDRGTSKEATSGSESFKWENGLLANSEASEDTKKCTTSHLEEICVNAISNLDAHKGTVQTPASSSASESFTPETAINTQTTQGMSADTEVLSNQSNEQRPPGERSSQLPNGKTQENSTMLNIEPNPGNPGNLQQRSKSPSFDFGLQLDARSEESDQTPLLHHDKTAARSFSGFANVRFQNRIIQTDYGRNSLDFEPVAVEEKTIRMERSDSDISRAAFMNLLKKDEKGHDQFSPQKQESPVTNWNSEELSTEELALTSPKERGKRKSRPSLFTSCICCTAAIH